MECNNWIKKKTTTSPLKETDKKGGDWGSALLYIRMLANRYEQNDNI